MMKRPPGDHVIILACSVFRSALPSLVFFTLVLASGVASALGFQFDEEHFVVDQAQQLRLVDDEGGGVAGVAIRATYYPGSEVSRDEVLCTTDREGHCTAAMAFAGVVVLSADHAGEELSERVSVRYDGMPMSALLIFLAAASVLFGGLFFGVRHIQQEGD